MGISVSHQLPDGRLVQIDSDVLGVDQKLREIDPRLCLCWDEERERFEVWHAPTVGPAYRVAAHGQCDDRLVQLVRERDQHAGVDILAAIDGHNAAARREQERRFEDWHDNEFAPRFQWALRKDLAQHLGGRGGVHSIPGGAA